MIRSIQALRIRSVLLVVALVLAVLAASTANGSPLAFNYNSSADSVDPHQDVYQQVFATGAITKLGSFGQHMMWWDADHRYAVSSAARYDEAYHWLNATVHDTQTGASHVLTDVDGTPLPAIAGGIGFGGFSADGRRFAMAIGSIDEAEGWGSPRILVFDSTTGRALGGTICSGPSLAAISPDGNRVVYSFGEDTQSLRMYDVSTGSDALWMSADQLDTATATRLRPVWPTGGNTIVINIWDAASPRHIHAGVINASTRAVRFSYQPVDSIYDVTSDGRYALVAKQPGDEAIGLCEMGRLDLNTDTYIRTLGVATISSFVSVPRAVLSPDGSRVLFEGWLEKGLQGHPTTYPANIYRCTVLGTDLAMVAMDARNPTWIPGEVAPLLTALSQPSVSPSRPTHGKTAIFTTHLTLGATGTTNLAFSRWESKTVRKRVKGKWKSVKVYSWKLRATKTMTAGADGHQTLKYKLPYFGKWKMVASYSGATDYTPSTSGVKTFTAK